MSLKPWYKVVKPRIVLRGDALTLADEFVVPLEQVRDGVARPEYQDPAQFFEQTVLTANLRELATGVLRRLGGTALESPALYSLVTPFGGGKSHALTLLLHLARGGSAALAWPGVAELLRDARVPRVTPAATAVFVGTEFDPVEGRGGDDGTPRRMTPWGEIAWQLGGAEAFALVAKHDTERIAPAGDVLRKLIPAEQPSLILIDELMAFVGRHGQGDGRQVAWQMFHFLQSLSEVVSSLARTVLVVAFPTSNIEVVAEELESLNRFRHMFNRLGRSFVLASGSETTAIICRRLFETPDKPKELNRVADAYGEWLRDHRSQLPPWFSIDGARESVVASYPFHPSVLGVFERKWQTLPRFQRTRGALSMLALWVMRAWQDGLEGRHADPLIELGSAPLEDSLFRTAVFAQLGEANLEGPVTTDIAGRDDSIAVRLDQEAVETLRQTRLHRKVATAIFFESNGGQARAVATLPEVRLAVGGPGLDIGFVETALDGLRQRCLYLLSEPAGLRFGTRPNLNKVAADRRLTIPTSRVADRAEAEVRRHLAASKRIPVVCFPTGSGDVPDRPQLSIVVAPLSRDFRDSATLDWIREVTRTHGASARVFKSALLWLPPDSPGALLDRARSFLAWDEIAQELDTLQLDEAQRRQASDGLKRAHGEFREAVGRTYHLVVFLGQEDLEIYDVGRLDADKTQDPIQAVLAYLQSRDVVQTSVAPAFLVRHWPPAFVEWSTRNVRDAFYATPRFPRLPDSEAVRDTIARGVSKGEFALVTKRSDGGYATFRWNTPTTPHDVEISDEVFIVHRQVAEDYHRRAVAARSSPEVATTAGSDRSSDNTMSETPQGPAIGAPRHAPDPAARQLMWAGEVPVSLWVQFYRQVLAPLAQDPRARASTRVEVDARGLSQEQIDAFYAALRDLGIDPADGPR